MPTNQFKTILTCDACKQPTDACAICKWPNNTEETNGDHRICCEACANKPMARRAGDVA